MDDVRCKMCGEVKPESAFPPSYINRRNNDGSIRGGFRCRDCKRIAERKWRADNPGRYSELQQGARSAKRARVTALKVDRGCARCGEKHPACLEFHHRSAAEKEHNISQLCASNAGWERIQTEIDKCDVLCSNCHRKMHWEEGYAEHYEAPAKRARVANKPRTSRSRWSGSRKREVQATDKTGIRKRGEAHVSTE